MSTNMRLLEAPGEQRMISFLPIGSLKVFGTNPYGESIFRVVWSESRDYLVGADHVVYDGDMANDATMALRGKDPNVVRHEFGYKRYPLYPAVKAWILERWKSGPAATGCQTVEQYNQRFMDSTTGLLTLGPYPERGDYFQCFTFPSEPGVTVVHEVIQRILAGDQYNYGDHFRANKEEMDKKEKIRTDRARDIILDAQQAFKNKPSNIRPGKRTKDKIRIKYSAQDLGINRRGFSTKP